MIFAVNIVFAQDKNDFEETEFIEAIVEFFLDNNEDSDLDYASLYDDFTDLYRRPLNLNHASKDELDGLYILNDLQINNLLLHIETVGKLMSTLELQSVTGFDLETIRKILPFVKVSMEFDQPRLNPKEILSNGKHEVFIRYTRIIEDQKGYSPPDTNNDGSLTTRYLGSPDKIYTRYRFKYATNISIGFVGEKDAGEEFYSGTNKVNNWYEFYKGFDFYSGHIFLKNIGPLKHLAIGDYQLQIGQGLTIWSGFARNGSKTNDVVAIKRNAQILRPYTSVNESDFLRGVATTLTYKGLELTGFYSQKKVDANISIIDSLSDEIQEVSSIQITGFHRTESEVFDERSILEQLYGGRLGYSRRNLNLGLTVVSSVLSTELNRNLRTYNQFEFSAKQNLNLGLDYNYVFQNMNFFGELSMSQNGGIAQLHGLIMSMDPRLTLTVLYRNYQRDYQSRHAKGFGETAKTSNEKGVYMGVEIKPNTKWTIRSYYDIFTFPWLRSTVDAPSRGNELLAELAFKPNKKMEMYLRYRKEMKEQNTRGDEIGVDFIEDRKRQLLRYDIRYKITESLKLRNRVDLADYSLGDNPKESGYMIMQDVTYKPPKSPVSLTLRYALFETESSNARIYMYEHDVLYASYIHSFSGKGSRFYVVLRYKVVRGIDVWLKYSQVYYVNAGSVNFTEGGDVIGSSLNTVQGSILSEIKAQIRFKF
ncbi:MAG: hypothetical protein COB85_00005 [Bacteroidetes bacterium]|nr:MAG: hypothetical protein COB85_00005 [Bacteroidota bacterium]